MLRKFVMHLYEYDTFAVHMERHRGGFVRWGEHYHVQRSRTRTVIAILHDSRVVLHYRNNPHER